MAKENNDTVYPPFRRMERLSRQVPRLVFRPPNTQAARNPFFRKRPDHLKHEMFKRIEHDNESVLDIGMGSGNFDLPLARRLKNGMMYCLDFLPEMTDRRQAMARRRAAHERIRMLDVDAGTTGLPDWPVEKIARKSSGPVR